MKTGIALVLLAIALLSQAAPSAQNQLQEIVATVRNSDGALVSGLRAEDFMLEVDGRMEPILSLAASPKNPVSFAFTIFPGPLRPTGVAGAIIEGDARVAAARILLRAATIPGDEYTLMALGGGRPAYVVVEPLTGDPGRIDAGLRSLYLFDFNSALLSRQEPATAFNLAARALAGLKNARYRTRSLIIAMDASWQKDPESLAKLRASEIPVYIIGIPTLAYVSPSQPGLYQEGGLFEQGIAVNRAADTKALNELAADIGGRATVILPNLDGQVVERLLAFGAEISVDLRGQYSLGFNTPAPIASQSQVIRLRTKNQTYQVRSRRLPAY